MILSEAYPRENMRRKPETIKLAQQRLADEFDIMISLPRLTDIYQLADLD